MTNFLYCRVSTSGQENNTSLQDQEVRGRAFIASQGWEEPDVYREVASGRDINRPALEKLRDAAIPGDRVIVLKLDRLSRSIVGGFPLIEGWAKAGISLHSVSEPIETGTAMGRSMLRMIFNFAETEREVIAERMAAGKSRKAQRGGFNGSPIPFGYRRGGAGGPDLVPDPSEAEVVRELFRLFGSGRYGARRLKRMTGCPLSEAAIGDVLANPLYAGRIRYQGDVEPGEHQAIVSDWLFRRAKAVKKARAKPVSRSGVRA